MPVRQFLERLFVGGRRLLGVHDGSDAGGFGQLELGELNGPALEHDALHR